jgi:hypothetical protein
MIANYYSYLLSQGRRFAPKSSRNHSDAFEESEAEGEGIELSERTMKLKTNKIVVIAHFEMILCGGQIGR